MRSNKILTVTLNPALDYTIEVDKFTPGRVNRASSGRRDPGGKGINVGTALSQRGHPVTLTGFLGRDNESLFLEHFKKHSLEDLFIRTDGMTREGIKIVESGSRTTSDINFPGFCPAKADLDAFSSQYQKLVPSYGYIVLSGSLPRGIHPEFYGELASRAKESGAFVAADCSGSALASVIESGAADLIKPNIEELSELYGELCSSDQRDRQLKGIMESLVPAVGMVALTLGPEGSLLYTGNGSYQVSAPAVPLTSTVGAGDSYLAGFLAAHAEGLMEEDILRNAASWAASSLTISGPGLSESNPPEEIWETIKVSRIS